MNITTKQYLRLCQTCTTEDGEKSCTGWGRSDTSDPKLIENLPDLTVPGTNDTKGLTDLPEDLPLLEEDNGNVITKPPKDLAEGSRIVDPNLL